MNNHLKITADIDDDGTVGLTGEVSSEGFSGYGEGWFNISEVKEFVSQLQKFAKTTNNPPEIFGGYYDDRGNLIHKLFGLRFYAISSYRLGLRIELANHPSSDCRPEEISSVSAELKPEAQGVIEFCHQLNQILLKKTEEANLFC